MNERMKTRLERLEKISQIIGENVYVADLYEGEYSVYNATRLKGLGVKSQKEFEIWIAEIDRTEPNSIIIIDDIPAD